MKSGVKPSVTHLLLGYRQVTFPKQVPYSSRLKRELFATCPLGMFWRYSTEKEQELKAHLSIKYERERRTILLVIDSCYLFPCGRAALVRSASRFTASLLFVP